MKKWLHLQHTHQGGVLLDNCCKWRECLSNLFPGTHIKHDLFHAVQRFLKMLSTQIPFRCALSKDYGLIFCSPKNNREMNNA